MNSLQFTVISLLFLTLTLAAPLDGANQWLPTQGCPIRQGWHIEWYRAGEARSLGQNSGEAAFVWADCRSGDRGIFTQLVDVNGQLKLPQNGIEVADAPGNQEDPIVWPDVDGGWFYAWEEFGFWTDERGHAQGDALGDIYCTKINAEGNRLWGSEHGVPVCVVPGIQEGVHIVHDGSGGCIVAWLDKRGGDPNNIYAMHLTADGRPDLNWPLNGQAVVEAPGEQTALTTDADGSGGMLIGWKDSREVGNADIRAQRILPDGSLFWGDRNGGISVCSHRSNQDTPKLCSDGHGGAFVTWVDDRNRLQTNNDIYAQRINARGELLWGAVDEGATVCAAAGEQSDNRVIMTEPGIAIVQWRSGGGADGDIYAQRILGDNQMVKTWQPEQGRPVVDFERNQMEARMCPDGQGGAYFIWEDERDGAYPEIDIWAQHLNVNGAPLFPAEGLPVCRCPATQQAPLVRRAADGGAVIVWQDTREGSPHLYIQKVSPVGGMQWQANGVPLAAGISQNATCQQLIPNFNGDNTFAVVWLDARFGSRGAIPFIQTCVDRGEQVERLLPQDGLPIIIGDVIGGAVSPKAFTDGDGTVITVWEDHRLGPRYSIYIQKTDENGAPMWQPSGVHAADFAYDQNTPYACSDGDGGAIAAWRAATDDDYLDIYAQRIDRQGARCWGDEGVLLTGNERDEYVQAMVSDGEGGAVLVWSAADNLTGDDLYIQRLNRNGEPMWSDQGGMALVRELNKQGQTVLARHREGFVAVWVDSRNEEGGQAQDDIYAQFIEPDGVTRFRQNGVPIFEDEYYFQESPALTIDNDGYIWVAWEDNRWCGEARQKDICLQKFTAAVDPNSPHYPSFLFNGMNGKVVCRASGDQQSPSIAHDKHNGVWLAWEDFRNSLWSDTYCIHLKPDGEPCPHSAADGNLVCDAVHMQKKPAINVIREDGATGAVLLWEDKRATSKEELSNLFVQRVDDYYLSARRIDEAVSPRGYALECVYPNPFNGQAFISFATPYERSLMLSVYDLSGRLVANVASGSWDAGRHIAVLEGNRLAAGSYIVRLTAGDVRLERLVQLVK